MKEIEVSYKRQILPKGLWVVATPIGNLQDLSFRAVQALGEAEILFCEDTRVTQKLLAGLGISSQAKKVRLDEYVSMENLEYWVREIGYLTRGAALVSDAGTPGISDPGAKLVSLARREGVLVTPLPGPSAVATLLSVSGFQETAFQFLGFLPRKPSEILRAFEEARQWRGVSIWFESPHRILHSLFQLAEAFPDANVCLGKELTKQYEKIFQGEAASVYRDLKLALEESGEVGEWAIAVQLPPEVKVSDWKKALICMMEARVSPSEAASRVSQHFEVSKKIVYQEALSFRTKLDSSSRPC